MKQSSLPVSLLPIAYNLSLESNVSFTIHHYVYRVFIPIYRVLFIEAGHVIV